MATRFDTVYRDPLYLKLYEERDTATAPADVEATLKLLDAKTGTLWLDVCCGFGRHTECLARAGMQVCGVDLSPLMVQRATRRAAEYALAIPYFRADMQALPFKPRFDVVSCLFDSFGYGRQPTDHLEAMLSMAGALHTGGRLVLQVSNREQLLHSWPPPAEETVGEFKIFRQWHLNLARGRYSWHQRITGNGVEREWNLDCRLFSALDLCDLMARAGFAPPQIYGNLQGATYGLDSSELVLIARKAAFSDLPPLAG